MKKSLSIVFFKGLILIILILSLNTLNSLAAQDYGLTEVAKKTGLFTEKTNIAIVISDVITVILGLLGLLTVILILIAGFQWMTAGGNAETIKKARERITNAVIGLIIIFCALSISYFVTRQLEKVTGTGEGGWHFEE